MADLCGEVPAGRKGQGEQIHPDDDKVELAEKANVPPWKRSNTQGMAKGHSQEGRRGDLSDPEARRRELQQQVQVQQDALDQS